jgi:hypothetical protein
MTRRGARRAGGARRRSDAGNATGVATAVLALLSAGALATLGLVSAGEIAGDLGRGLGLGPGSGRVERPGGVVVSGPTDGSGGAGGSGSGSNDAGGGPEGLDLLVPVPGRAGVVLPSPSGVAASPDAPVPATDPVEPPPVVQPLPNAEPSAPPVATRTVRVAPGHGRSATAPGHTRRTPGPTLFAAPGLRGKPVPVATPQERGRSGQAPGRLRPTPVRPDPPIVVPGPIPTPVRDLVTGGVPGPPATPPGQAKTPGQDQPPGQPEPPGRS